MYIYIKYRLQKNKPKKGKQKIKKNFGTLLAEIRVENLWHDSGSLIFELVHVATTVG